MTRMPLIDEYKAVYHALWTFVHLTLNNLFSSTPLSITILTRYNCPTMHFFTLAAFAATAAGKHPDNHLQTTPG